jgi:hypothetical protein
VNNSDLSSPDIVDRVPIEITVLPDMNLSSIPDEDIFDAQMAEAKTIYAEAIISDLTGDTLEAAYQFEIIASAYIVLASAIWASKISSSGMEDKFISGRTVISIGTLSTISGEDRSLLFTCKLSDENNNENTNNVNRILIINSFYRFFDKSFIL